MAGLTGINVFGKFSLAAGASKTFNSSYCLIIICNVSSGRSFIGYKDSNAIKIIHETSSTTGSELGDIGVASTTEGSFTVTNRTKVNVTLRIVAISSRLDNLLD